MLTVYDDDERIFNAVCAGATGYLLKKTPPARLLEYIRETLEGGSPMSPQIARRVMTLFHRVRPPESTHEDLTPHELRLLKLLVEGYRYEDVASQMGVSINTVRSHIKHIYGKLQVHSKSEAVAKALRSGLVD
jgi:DNA-binding NarL/FixJ family response regulator